MTRAKLLLGLGGITLLVLAGIGAALLVAPAKANPPFKNATYDLYGGPSPMRGVLVTSADGNSLVAGSFINADCMNGATKLFTAHADLTGIAINNPAGIINAFPPATKQLGLYDSTPSTAPGTIVNPRLFMHWYPQVASAPTQTPPTGNPGGQAFATPDPADFGTGSWGGRNNPPSARDQTGFCSWSVNFAAIMRH